MSKKLLYLLVLPAFLLLFACGNNNAKNQPDEKEAAEIKQSDSLTTEMDNIQAEIEAKRAELEKLLEEIEE